MTFDKTLPLHLTQALLPFTVLHLFSSHDALTVQGFHFIKSYPHMISTRTVNLKNFQSLMSPICCPVLKDKLLPR